MESGKIASGNGLLWVTNHPGGLKGMWPRRVGADYIEGMPKGTDAYTPEELKKDGILGIYVDMSRGAYLDLPVARNPMEYERILKSLDEVKKIYRFD